MGGIENEPKLIAPCQCPTDWGAKRHSNQSTFFWEKNLGRQRLLGGTSLLASSNIGIFAEYFKIIQLQILKRDLKVACALCCALFYHKFFKPRKIQLNLPPPFKNLKNFYLLEKLHIIELCAWPPLKYSW